MLPAALFYFFSLLTLTGAVLCVTRRNPVLSGAWLIVSLLGVAGLFLLMGAEFLFVAQIILYIGGRHCSRAPVPPLVAAGDGSWIGLSC